MTKPPSQRTDGSKSKSSDPRASLPASWGLPCQCCEGANNKDRGKSIARFRKGGEVVSVVGSAGRFRISVGLETQIWIFVTLRNGKEKGEKKERSSRAGRFQIINI